MYKQRDENNETKHLHNVTKNHTEIEDEMSGTMTGTTVVRTTGTTTMTTDIKEEDSMNVTMAIKRDRTTSEGQTTTRGNHHNREMNKHHVHGHHHLICMAAHPKGHDGYQRDQNTKGLMLGLLHGKRLKYRRGATGTLWTKMDKGRSKFTAETRTNYVRNTTISDHDRKHTPGEVKAATGSQPQKERPRVEARDTNHNRMPTTEIRTNNKGDLTPGDDANGTET